MGAVATTTTITVTVTLVVIINNMTAPPHSRQHLNNDVSLEGQEGRLSELFSVVLCTTVVHSDMHAYEQFLKLTVGLDLSFLSYLFCHFVLACERLLG